MLTNGEHDRLWVYGAKSLPGIEKALNRANAIACIKELYSIGEMTKEDYTKSLMNLVESSGYSCKK